MLSTKGEEKRESRCCRKRDKNVFSSPKEEEKKMKRGIRFFALYLARPSPSSLSSSIDRMASSSHRRAERLRSLLSRSEALIADTDAALARCESDLGRAAELVAPTVARTQVRREAMVSEGRRKRSQFFFLDPSLDLALHLPGIIRFPPREHRFCALAQSHPAMFRRTFDDLAHENHPLKKL